MEHILYNKRIKNRATENMPHSFKTTTITYDEIDNILSQVWTIKCHWGHCQTCQHHGSCCLYSASFHDHQGTRGWNSFSVSFCGFWFHAITIFKGLWRFDIYASNNHGRKSLNEDKTTANKNSLSFAIL